MHLSFVGIAVITISLVVSMASSEANQPTMIASNDGQSNTDKRFLRNLKLTDKTTANDEERGLFGDFAKSDLKKMLKRESFKLEMFKKWDAHTVGHIREKLGVDPLNTRWESLLFDYLNVYKKAGDEVVRHANNAKKVKFAKKAQARIYRTNS
ncbi:Secreted RxLR effector peptide protein [Phytophthora palmivora]|uniref:RxLR effector protein n=1 Tax=Phytophthora palmivora TaxID=4796 RepID=A0A2P4YBK9_9STRA|nr:Secreted RxLR effector peptide protein [Phytophthora palmivora]